MVAALIVAGGCGQAVGTRVDGGLNGNGNVNAVDAGPIVVGKPQWAMAGATNQRNGRSAFVGPTQVTEQVVELSTLVEGNRPQVFVNAVGPDGTVYSVVRDINDLGRLVSLLPDGSIKWDGVTDVMGGVALTDDGVLLIEGARRVAPVDDPTSPVDTMFGVGSNGAMLWTGRHHGVSVVNREHRHSAPLVDGAGNVYVVLPIEGDPELTSSGFHLCSFDYAGAFRWCWDRVLGRYIYINPAMDLNGVLYVAVENQSVDASPVPESPDGVYTLDSEGVVLWSLPLPHMQITTVALGDDSMLYYTGFSTGVFIGSVEPTGGKGWTATLGPFYQAATTSVAITPADGPDPTIYLGAWHDPDGEGSEGSITALDPDGVQRWRVETGGTPCGGMAVDATGAVYAMVTGGILAVNPARVLGLEPDGSTRLSAELQTPSIPGMGCLVVDVTHFNTSVVLGDGRIYIGSAEGNLHILAP